MFPHKLHLNYEEKNGTLQQINLVNTTLIKVNINLPTNTGANQHHVPLDMLPWDGHISSVVFPHNADHDSSHEKKSDKSKLRGILQNKWSEVLNMSRS